MKRRKVIATLATGLGFTTAGCTSSYHRMTEESNSPTDIVEPIWSYEASGVLSNVDGQLLYGKIQQDRTTDKLIALNTESGNVEWDYSDAGWTESITIPVANDFVHTGISTDVVKIGAIKTFDSDGSERWKVEMGSVQKPPLLSDEVVFVASDDGKAYALDQNTGDEIWSVPFNPEATVPRPSIEEIENDTVYVIYNKTIQALSAETGDTVWRYDLQKESDISVVSHNETLYFASNDRAGAIADGELQWSTEEGAYEDVLGIIDNILIAKRADDIKAIDASSGDNKWENKNVASCHLTDDGLLLGASDVVFLTQSGKEEWSTSLDNTNIISLTSYDDSIYAFTENSIYRLNDSGEITLQANIPNVQSYTQDGSKLYVATSDEIKSLDM